MKSECDIRVMRANEEAELRQMFRDDLSDRGAWLKEIILNTRIELMKEILETEDNSCY